MDWYLFDNFGWQMRILLTIPRAFTSNFTSTTVASSLDYNPDDRINTSCYQWRRYYCSGDWSLHEVSCISSVSESISPLYSSRTYRNSSGPSANWLLKVRYAVQEASSAKSAKSRGAYLRVSFKVGVLPKNDLLTGLTKKLEHPWNRTSNQRMEASACCQVLGERPGAQGGCPNEKIRWRNRSCCSRYGSCSQKLECHVDIECLQESNSVFPVPDGQ